MSEVNQQSDTARLWSRENWGLGSQKKPKEGKAAKDGQKPWGWEHKEPPEPLLEAHSLSPQNCLAGFFSRRLSLQARHLDTEQVHMQGPQNRSPARGSQWLGVCKQRRSQATRREAGRCAGITL